MLGLGIDIFRSKRLSSGFSFSDSDAKAYWDALTVANGSPIDCPTIYGVSNATVMAAIDDFYVATKADNTYSEINEMYLYIGGTDVTHAISGKTATSTLTYIGSPTHDLTGMILNGTTQYGVLPNIANTYTTTNDSHISMFMGTTNDFVGMGSRASNGAETWIRCLAGPTLEWTAHRASAGSGYSTYSATTVELQKVIVGSITAASSTLLYVDGTNVANGGTNSGLVDSTYQPFIGCINLAGNPNGLSAGNVKFSSIGTGLTSSQVTTLTNAVKTLNTTLGR